MKVSRLTDTKQETFEACLRWHLSVVDAINTNSHNSIVVNSYNYIDCFCGEGHYKSPNDGLEHEGSPVIFCRAIMSGNYSFDVNPFFNDYKAKHIEQLETRLRFDVGFQEFELFNLDFQEFLAGFNIPKWQNGGGNYGVVYLDPYNQFTKGELQTIRQFVDRNPLIDVMLNFPATSLKRCIGAKEKSGYNYEADYIGVYETLSLLNKRYWWIRLPIKGDKTQWCFVLGSNYKFRGGYKKFNITSIDTAKGKDALEHFALTNEQKKNKKQGRFW